MAKNNKKIDILKVTRNMPSLEKVNAEDCSKGLLRIMNEFNMPSEKREGLLVLATAMYCLGRKDYKEFLTYKKENPNLSIREYLELQRVYNTIQNEHNIIIE